MRIFSNDICNVYSKHEGFIFKKVLHDTGKLLFLPSIRNDFGYHLRLLHMFLAMHWIHGHIMKLMMADNFLLSADSTFRRSPAFSFSEQWSHMIAHTLMNFHVLKHAGANEISFCSARRPFIDLSVSILLHHLYFLTSLWWSLSIVSSSESFLAFRLILFAMLC